MAIHLPVQLQRHTFTVSDYHRMLEAGILTEDDRVELICGEIIAMAPIGTRHATCVNGLNEILGQVLRRRAVVSIQNPVVVGEGSEPQPDIAVTRLPRSRYANAHPTPADIFLLIEVADTTAVHDREMKVPLYGKAGVPETWLIDLATRRIEAYREPSANGYRSLRYAYPGDTLTPSSFPDVTLAVDEVLV